MRAVVQRVSSARVEIAGATVGAIGRGLLVLLGAETGDIAEDAIWLAGKIVAMRLFPASRAGEGLWEKSVAETGGEILAISQFTLLASTRKGTKPSWHRAARPEVAEGLYERMLIELCARLGRPVQAGRFGAMMQVSLVNDGPVTILLDSKSRD